ncbi:YfhO family protein [Lysobacter sp. A421]
MDFDNRFGKYRSPARLVFLAFLYAIIGVIVLGANPLKGETTGPFDLLASYPGWQPEDDIVAVRNRERSDILDSLVPEWTEAKKQITSGILPLWNPLPAGGHGALFEPTRSLLTPAFLLFLLTPDPAFGFYLAVLSSLIFAGLGMHLFVARRCHEIAGLFSGISYMMCGFITAWLFWPHTLTAIWIPWLLLAVDIFVTKRSLGALAGVAVTMALMFLGGFPFVVAIGIGAALVYAAVVSSGSGPRNMVLATSGVAIGLALGLCLVAVHLLGIWTMLQDIYLGYRHGGTPFGLSDAKLLSRPWASASPRVEANMFVGTLALLLSACGLVALLIPRTRRMALVAIIFIFVGGALVFGVLPVEWGRQLPVLSSNPWSRAILLLDIGIILLAAAGLDWLLRRINKKAFILTSGLLICGVQGVDLLYQFRHFNGPTPAEYYYATGDDLKDLSARIGRFQYIVQDASYFMISGTTGTLGLGDWYGHSLRSPAMRDLLASMAVNPFSSPTSTSLRISSFNLSDPKMDAVANCYAIYPSTESHEVLRAPGHQRYAMPAFDGQQLTQIVAFSSKVTLSAVAVRLATYAAVGLDGDVTLIVAPVGKGQSLLELSRPASEVVDNRFVEFEFEQDIVLPAGHYSLQLDYKPGPKDKRLTAWIMRGGSGLSLGDAVLDGTLEYVLYGPPTDAMEIVSDNGHITIAHNRGCLEGPYWTGNLADPVPTADTAIVSLENYVPHDFTLTVAAMNDGYVVVPMQYQPGWTATLDGEPQIIERVFGVMPAVAVDKGESTIRFSYSPPRWKLGLGISGGAIAMLLLAWFLQRRRKPQ